MRSMVKAFIHRDDQSPIIPYCFLWLLSKITYHRFAAIEKRRKSYADRMRESSYIRFTQEQ